MARQFPSEWSLKKLQQADNTNYVVGHFAGLPYLYRVVNESDQQSKQQATLECQADFKVTVMKEGDRVVLNPTDYSTKIKGSILPIIQALLLNMKEGDKFEAIAPAALAFGDDEDVYVEVELKKIHYYTGVKFVWPSESA